MTLTEDEIFLNIAHEYANFSKCQFTKVASIAVNESKRIIATGVNGTLPGSENCESHFFEARDDHIAFTRDHELHAEANLVLELAKIGTTFSELTIYQTISPCAECLKLLLGLGRVSRIVFSKLYHRTTEAEFVAMKQRAERSGVILCCFEDELYDTP